MAVVDAIQLAQVVRLGAWQMEVALREADARVEDLATAVGEIGASARSRVRESVSSTLDGEAPQCGESGARDLLELNASKALVALQFYDQLVQRIQHVRDSLMDLTEWLESCESEQSLSLDEVLARVYAHYTMEDERKLFTALLGTSGGPVLQEAEPHRGEASRSSTELF